MTSRLAKKGHDRDTESLRNARHEVLAALAVATAGF